MCVRWPVPSGRDHESPCYRGSWLRCIGGALFRRNVAILWGFAPWQFVRGLVGLAGWGCIECTATMPGVVNHSSIL